MKTLIKIYPSSRFRLIFDPSIHLPHGLSFMVFSGYTVPSNTSISRLHSDHHCEGKRTTYSIRARGAFSVAGSTILDEGVHMLVVAHCGCCSQSGKETNQNDLGVHVCGRAFVDDWIIWKLNSSEGCWMVCGKGEHGLTMWGNEAL